MARVLVIDDDAPIAELMRVILEEAGHSATVVTDAAALPSGGIDCVVSDLMTVDLYSRERARAWVALLRERYPGVPIVLVSAHVGAGHDQDALAVQGVIVKPFDVDHLPEAVGEAIAGRRYIRKTP